MKDFLTRRSVIAFIIICFLGILGPMLISGYPSDVVGAPFARPIWWDTKLPATSAFNVTDGGVSFEWEKLPPAIFSLNGQVRADAKKEVKIFWQTPRKKYLLLSLKGQDVYWVNIDARDMVFKQSLGMPLIGNGAEHLFPCTGKYSLIVQNARATSLKLMLPGKRQGWLGTDQRGRDVLRLLIYGIRTSLIIGIAATLIACLLGLGFGLAAGYIGGLTDALIMRTVDVLLSIPTLPILMVLAGIWGKGLWQLVLILSVFSWMGTARSVRSMVLSVRESPWVESLKALGAKRSYILWRHLVPETAPIMLANLALGVPGAILSEAGLAFLGLSDPRLISWGRMLHEAHSFGAFTEGAWWLLLPPGIGIVVICLIFMDMGRYLEERIDPRLGGKKNA
jgi:peptide/nickel transport system permease protein